MTMTMRKKRKAENGEDRMSELSDDILCHILSFLPSNEAIATCLLSKRWRFLWTMVPAFDFDLTILKTHEKVNKFLSLRRTQGISRFHLTYNIHHSCLVNVDKWVSAAIDGKVEQLSISISRYNCEGLLFFPTLFNCTTLVTLNLKLKGSIVLCVPSSVHLPSLKTFHLEANRYVPFFSLRHLVYGSPALELFHLKQESNHRLNELKILRSSRHIRLLERKRVSNDVVCDLVIQSEPPYDFIADYLDRHLENVVKAKAYITLYDTLHKCSHVNSYVFSTLKALRNAEFISLSDFRVEMTGDDGPFTLDDLAQFQNLLQLHLHLKDAHSLFTELPANCSKLPLFNFLS